MKTMNLSGLTTSIYSIYDVASQGLNPEFAIKYPKRPMNLLKKFFGVEEQEVFILVYAVYRHFEGDTTKFQDFQEFFSLQALHMLEFQPVLNSLVDKGILVNRRDPRYTETNAIDCTYSLAPDAAKAIADKTPIRKNEKSYTSSLDVMEGIYNLTEKATSTKMVHQEYMKRYSDLMTTCNKIPYASLIKTLHLPVEEEVVFGCIVWKLLSTNEVLELDNAALVYESLQDQVRFKQSIFNETNPLIQLDLVTLTTGFLDSTSLSLTSKAAEILGTVGFTFKIDSKRKNERILPTEISEKHLVYNDSEQIQIASLESILKEENYVNLRNRLAAKHLPVGLNVLLFGAPGTGKTETVYQLARQTGREIIRVEIAETKSKWYGESEKLIKDIFTKYTETAKNCSLMPILLFNEADAIISNRKSNSHGDARQTENAVQNILLEELEKFNGIFFATTNLANNLDSAFDRRFLYKVKFLNPGLTQRQRILERKFPFLCAKECEFLATEFDLSGGQMDNIARKSEIHYIMNGDNPTFENVTAYCQEELAITAKKTVSIIGFTRE
jgi:AAA+ superfamily predicted ATPase